MAPSVIVVGGGIGGLTAALKLHQAGADVRVFEKYSELRPHISATRGAGGLGLGINLLPHCTQVLHSLGLEHKLRATAILCERMILATNQGMKVWEEPRGLKAGHSTPHYSIHRAALAEMLGAAALSRIGAGRIHLRHSLVSFEQRGEKVIATFKPDDKQEVSFEADAMIGADGIHSVTRRLVGYDGKPQFTGWVAYRGCAKIKPPFDGKTMVIMGELQDDDMRVIGGEHRGSFVSYPMSQGVFEDEGKALLNWVCEYKVPLDCEPGREAWDVVGDPEDILKRGFGRFRFGPLRGDRIIAASEKVYKFVVYDRDPVDRWTFGRVTLLGDAAHPMLPFGSQGAGQAILDADALAEAVWEAPGDMPAALRAYERARLQKANGVVTATRRGGDHLPFEALQAGCAGKVVRDIEAALPRAEIQRMRDEYMRIAGYSVQQLKPKL